MALHFRTRRASARAAPRPTPRRAGVGLARRARRPLTQDVLVPPRWCPLRSCRPGSAACRVPFVRAGSRPTPLRPRLPSELSSPADRSATSSRRWLRSPSGPPYPESSSPAPASPPGPGPGPDPLVESRSRMRSSESQAHGTGRDRGPRPDRAAGAPLPRRCVRRRPNPPPSTICRSPDSMAPATATRRQRHPPAPRPDSGHRVEEKSSLKSSFAPDVGAAVAPRHRAGGADQEVGDPSRFSRVGTARRIAKADKLLRQNHARQHHRRARRRIDRERLDPGHRNLGYQQNTAHRAVAGNPRAAKVFQLLARHLDHRDDADVGCAGGKLGRAIRGQGEAQIESLAELGVRGMLDAPNQRYGIEVADGADARPGDGMIRMQLFSVATGRHEV